MWFTKVSLKNPVFATMVMLAIVVLGLFSLQRLKVDQFPNIDFPVVVVLTEYPGASPEIVESEVTKKIEEGVNSIAGISALTSRTYEGQSVVVLEFDLNTNSRKAAEDGGAAWGAMMATMMGLAPEEPEPEPEPELPPDPVEQSIDAFAQMLATSRETQEQHIHTMQSIISRMMGGAG